MTLGYLLMSDKNLVFNPAKQSLIDTNSLGSEYVFLVVINQTLTGSVIYSFWLQGYCLLDTVIIGLIIWRNNDLWPTTWSVTFLMEDLLSKLAGLCNIKEKVG